MRHIRAYSLLLVTVLVGWSAIAAAAEPRPIPFRTRTMGTWATVVARTACLADAWATALFVLGPEAARRTAAISLF